MNTGSTSLTPLSVLWKTALVLPACFLISCDQARDTEASEATIDKEPVAVVPPRETSFEFFKSGATWLERVEQVRRELPLLPKAQLSAYLEYIGSHHPSVADQEDYWVIMNEILEVARKQNLLPERYTELLTGYLADPETNHMVRDYAAQHLGIWLSGDGEAREQSPQRMQAGLQGLADAFTNPQYQQETTAGTALMALYDASERLPVQHVAPVWDTLEPQLPALLERSSTVLKTSLINVAGLRKVTALHAQIQTYAASHPSDSVRLSSIAALGSYQDPSDKPLLTQIKNSKTKFTYAATSALNKF